MPKYDLAVAGAGLGGLAAAALVSSGGKKVIVLESGSSLDAALGGRESEGFRFCSGPSLVYGFEEGGPGRAFFSGLGALPEGLKPVSLYQVALPDRRVTVSANREETLDELKREFPAEFPAIQKFYLDIAKESLRIRKSKFAAFFAKRKSAAGFLGRYRFSQEFRMFLEIQSRNFFRKTLAQLSVPKLIQLCETMPTRLPGGTRLLATRLLDVIRKSGGEVVFGKGPAELTFKSGRAVGMQSEQRMVEAGAFLLTVPNQYPQCVYLGILDDVVPLGMADEVLYLASYAAPDDFLSISVSPDGDLSSAPMSARALTVALPAGTSERDRSAFLGPLAEIVPYLNDNIFFVEPRKTVSPSYVLPSDVSSKPIKSGDSRPVLFKTSKRNLYVLQDEQGALPELLSAVKKFVSTIS